MLTACERAPGEPESVNLSPVSQLPADQPPPEKSPSSQGAGGTSPTPLAPEAETHCLHPLLSPPPPPAHSAAICPPDPEGRPTMPTGSVTFPEAPEAPHLRVELAQTVAHRTHGLMFRPELADAEGMLFSWPEERPRSFWMHNTCLALDMLFIAMDGTISGILEHVPPMTDTPRNIPCPVAHVLEVRAGWTRQYAVVPGQKIEFTKK